MKKLNKILAIVLLLLIFTTYSATNNPFSIKIDTDTKNNLDNIISIVKTKTNSISNEDKKVLLGKLENRLGYLYTEIANLNSNTPIIIGGEQTLPPKSVLEEDKSPWINIHGVNFDLFSKLILGIEKGKYKSFKMKTGNEYRQLKNDYKINGGLIQFEEPVSPYNVSQPRYTITSISENKGEFFPVSSRCSSKGSIAGSLRFLYSDSSRAPKYHECILNPNKNYYINVSYSDIPGIIEGTGCSKKTCYKLFGVFPSH